MVHKQLFREGKKKFNQDTICGEKGDFWRHPVVRYPPTKSFQQSLEKRQEMKEALIVVTLLC